MKIFENIQLITFPAHCRKKVHAFLGFNKITNYDQIHTFQVKHIPFSINKHQCIFFSWDSITLVKSSVNNCHNNT